MDPHQTIEEHVRRFFAGHAVTTKRWHLGGIVSALPRHQVLAVSPGPRSRFWTYVTVGAWAAQEDVQQEYMLIAREPSDLHVELLSMISFYGIEHTLLPGDTVPIGRPVVPGSPCKDVYFSVPYPYGPELEVCDVGDGHVHIYWAFPITSREKELLLSEGVEELEQRFEAVGVEYWNPFRKSVA